MKTPKDHKQTHGISTIKLLYFILIIVPYALMLFLIFTYTSYTLLVQLLIAGLFAYGWHGTAVKLFNKFYTNPYTDSLKDNLIQLAQYVAALVLANIVIVSIIGNP